MRSSAKKMPAWRPQTVAGGFHDDHSCDAGIIATLSPQPDADGRPAVVGQEKVPALQTAGERDADAIRQRVNKGQRVRITDDQGREWQGRIEALAADNLALLTKDRQAREVPYAAIVRIDRPRDTVANGAKTGFVSGAAFGLFVVVAVAIDDRGFCCGVPAAAYVSFPQLTVAQGRGSVSPSTRWSGETPRSFGAAILG